MTLFGLKHPNKVTLRQSLEPQFQASKLNLSQRDQKYPLQCLEAAEIARPRLEASNRRRKIAKISVDSNLRFAIWKRAKKPLI